MDFCSSLYDLIAADIQEMVTFCKGGPRDWSYYFKVSDPKYLANRMMSDAAGFCEWLKHPYVVFVAKVTNCKVMPDNFYPLKYIFLCYI